MSLPALPACLLCLPTCLLCLPTCLCAQVGIGVDDAGSVVYVTGKFKYSITVGGIYISGSNYVGQTGMLVAKLNASNGAVLWADGWGGKADTAGHLVAVPRSGDCAYAVM